MNVAKTNADIVRVGDTITFFDGYYGKVERIYPNSVIVAITTQGDKSFDGNKTVVNHRKYKIVS